MAIAYLTAKGNIKDVVAKLKSMDNTEFNNLKASALSAAAKRQKGAN